MRSSSKSSREERRGLITSTPCLGASTITSRGEAHRIVPFLPQVDDGTFSLSFQKSSSSLRGNFSGSCSPASRAFDASEQIRLKEAQGMREGQLEARREGLKLDSKLTGTSRRAGFLRRRRERGNRVPLEERKIEAPRA